ncbi:hypothetical protein [Nostoc sp. 106C]|uniref:hypothetical protein n=1 Tax=Nostoc sp. 106C TaxID=1932667 RepID=UPI001413060A|nr:hypothetical protein [Nostoc sp. 106C]
MTKHGNVNPEVATGYAKHGNVNPEAATGYAKHGNVNPEAATANIETVTDLFQVNEV